MQRAPLRQPLAGYIIAFVGTALVAWARWAAGGVVGADVPLLPFILSVMFTAWYGGTRPGLAATAAGAAVGSYLFVPTVGPLWPSAASDRARLLIFLTEGAVISYLCGALHSAKRSADAHARDALDKQRRFEDADRRKNDFLATFAHELRNPLSAIRYATYALPEAGDNTAPDPRRTIDRSVSLVLRLVDDLSDLCRIGRGRLDLQMEAVDLADVVRWAVESLRPAVDSHGHSIKVDIPDDCLAIRGDSVRLIQIVGNLITNSVKYTPAGGRICVTSRVEGGDAVVRVRDNGVGIPADKLASIFGLFTQVERNLDRSEGGLGIGLALVRTLVELHGGQVEAFSDGPGTGCEFVVRLPLDANASPAAGRTESQLRPASRRILIVDEYRSAVDSLAAAISRVNGHDVRVAYSAAEALRAVADCLPEIVLLDLDLRGASVYDMARQIRAVPALAKTVLVAMSGRAQPAERGCRENDPFHRRLVKPVGYPDIERLLAEL